MEILTFRAHLHHDPLIYPKILLFKKVSYFHVDTVRHLKHLDTTPTDREMGNARNVHFGEMTQK
jgi:hypothetical protein